MKHILVATDGSELAGKAVSEGVRLASGLGAQLTFLTVTAPFASLGDHDAAFARLPETVRAQALAYLDREANETLSAALSAARAAGVKADIIKVESRHPHEAIIATAKSKGADLIVVASHGRSGVKSLLLGSVTDKVLTHAHIPVLVCR
ncbi:MAG: universal stress protein [Hyphomicrobiaceae bacterium]